MDERVSPFKVGDRVLITRSNGSFYSERPATVKIMDTRCDPIWYGLVLDNGWKTFAVHTELKLISRKNDKMEVIEMAAAFLRALLTDGTILADLVDMDILDAWASEDVAKVRLVTLEEVLEVLR